MKGIILAGGSGTRLYPVSKVTSKHLLPVYDKPLIYYPLSVLMLAGIKNILIISSADDINNFKELFGDGSSLGISIEYKEQPSPNGIAEAFILGEEFIGLDSVCLILGDNIFYGHGLTNLLKKAVSLPSEANLFAYQVSDPENYGVLKLNKNNKILSIKEKPKKFLSNLAVTGIYFYNNNVISIAKKIKPSKRGELEITSINQIYLKKNKLSFEILGRGYAWLDTGTHDSLLEASQFIETVETRQGYKIACLEEIAFNNKWINKNQLKDIAASYIKCAYRKYLLKILSEKK